MMNLVEDTQYYYIYLAQSTYCRCLNTKSRYFISYYKQNCLYDYITTFIKNNTLNEKKRLIVYLDGRNATFIKQLNYAYYYRRQNNLPLPENLGALNDKKNLKLWLTFLIDEYFNNGTKTYSGDIAPLVNPINQYKNCSCAKNSKNMLYLKSGIIILPNIE